jgi:hypothetical protein
MNSFTSDEISTMVSIGDIARANGHSRIAVSRAVTRLKIKPLIEHPYRMFDRGVIDHLRQRMRARRPINTEAAP